MSPSTYAKGTTVLVERSKAEIDGLLGKHGAGSRGIFWNEETGVAAVVFVLGGRKYKMTVPMPMLEDVDAEVKKSPPKRWAYMTPEQRDAFVRARWEQQSRERWRGLVLLVKAKLEIVRMGVSSFEREFLADLLLPNGRTASEELGEYMQKLLENGYSAPLALPEAEDVPEAWLDDEPSGGPP